VTGVQTCALPIYSTGMAFTWISPVGPIKLSYAVPLNKQPEDKLQKFQFNLGSMF